MDISSQKCVFLNKSIYPLSYVYVYVVAWADVPHMHAGSSRAQEGIRFLGTEVKDHHVGAELRSPRRTASSPIP